MRKSDSLHNIIKSPVITEKATEYRANLNKYTFYVDKRYNKLEIKKAIEEVFKVNVISINTLNVTGKKKRLGRFIGRKSGKKKAVVTLKEGDRITIMEGP
ncbi:50S ribosomal protein L23 [Elusimicrobiota bacterium]